MNTAWQGDSSFQHPNFVRLKREFWRVIGVFIAGKNGAKVVEMSTSIVRGQDSPIHMLKGLKRKL